MYKYTFLVDNSSVRLKQYAGQKENIKIEGTSQVIVRGKSDIVSKIQHTIKNTS